MDHKTSVKSFHPLIVHNVQLTEKYEHLAKLTKSKPKQSKLNNKAKKYRQKAKQLAQQWGNTTNWNVNHWQYVLDKKKKVG